MQRRWLNRAHGRWALACLCCALLGFVPASLSLQAAAVPVLNAAPPLAMGTLPPNPMATLTPGQTRTETNPPAAIIPQTPSSTRTPATRPLGAACGAYPQPSNAPSSSGDGVTRGLRAEPARVIAPARAAGTPGDIVQGATGPGWVTLACQTFESDWPSAGWMTFDGNGSGNGAFCWGASAFQAFASFRSVWPAGGCLNGFTPSAGALYPANADSWMVFGPLSLEGLSAVELHFRLWAQIQNGDSLFWGASSDGFAFGGVQVTGSSTGSEPPTDQGWVDITLDLANVPDAGSFIGQSQVWLAWRLVSDGGAQDQGPFVDDVWLSGAPVGLATPTPSRTSTRTPSPTTPTTASPTRSPTPAGPTRTPTPSPTSAVGGHSFTLRADGVVTSWLGGIAQTGYSLIRWTPPSDYVFYPIGGGFLAPATTSYADFLPRPALAYCYVLFVVGGHPPSYAQVLGISDLLCLLTGWSSGNAPSQFQVRLDQSNLARLTWVGPGGQDGYQVIATRFDGTPNRTMSRAGNVTSLNDDTTGQTTCYQVVARAGNQDLGRTDFLCAAPGVADFPSGSAANLRRWERVLGPLGGSSYSP